MNSSQLVNIIIQEINFVFEKKKKNSLKQWFEKDKDGSGPAKSGGWVDGNTCRKDKKTGRKKCKPCGRQKGEKRSKYPACRPSPSKCAKRGNWGKKAKKGKK